MQKKKKVTTSKTKTPKKSPAAVAKTVAKPAKKAAPAKITAKPMVEKAPVAVAKPASEEGHKPRVDVKSLSAEAQEQYKKWLKLHKQLGEEKVEEYKMTADYEIKVPLKHKVHGWGVVIQKRDNYIDVLFEIGMKTLIVNYKDM
jgi:hypothetical protein